MIRFQARFVLALVALALSPSLPAFGAAPLIDDEEAAAEEEEKEPKDRYLVVLGADIHTGNGEVLRDGRLLAKNGKIVAIGYDDFEVPGLDYDREVPADERGYELEILDASNVPNGRVYPGMVAFSSSGLLGGGGDYRDSIDMFNRNMLLGLAAGITTTGQTSSTAKLKRYVPGNFSRDYDFDGVVIGGKTLSTVSWGTAASKRSAREKLAGAAAYLRTYRQWQVDVKKDKELKEPSKSGVDSTMLAVLRGEIFARFSADYQDDLSGIARVAMEFGFRPVITGCREGWVVADELGRAGAMAVLTPRTRRSKDEQLVAEGGSSIENAAILHSHGVQVAIIPGSRGIDLGGIAGRDIMHLPIEVGFAIRGGLPDDAGLASVTTVPARLLGVGHRVGTLEVGKDCDLIVTDGDLLHYQTFVQYTVVDGDLVYDKQDELYFAHIRPRDDSLLAPLVPFDPAEVPIEEEGDDEGEDSEEGDDEDE
ncbi:MAG: amidohydrolase family protein [Planctomycetes bacterium]|nr:amidohydrolase family protein [Planctomycetota bacterium]